MSDRELHEPYVGAWDEKPWPLAVEMSNALPPASWSLVGGLMVQTHAHLNRIELSRGTSDVDAILRLGEEKSAFASTVSALRDRGFELSQDEKHAYRFVRGADIIDVMIADREKRRWVPTYNRRPLFPVRSGARAVSGTSMVSLQGSGGALARFALPSLTGALALKAAAFKDDSREKARHLEDGIVLLACLTDASEVRNELGRRSSADVKLMLRNLDENRRVWRNLPQPTQRLAKDQLVEMIHRFDAYGRDNSATQGRTQQGLAAPASSRRAPARTTGQMRQGDCGVARTANGGNSGSFASYERGPGTPPPPPESTGPDDEQRPD